MGTNRVGITDYYVVKTSFTPQDPMAIDAYQDIREGVAKYHDPVIDSLDTAATGTSRGPIDGWAFGATYLDIGKKRFASRPGGAQALSAFRDAVDSAGSTVLSASKAFAPVWVNTGRTETQTVLEEEARALLSTGQDYPFIEELRNAPPLRNVSREKLRERFALELGLSGAEAALLAPITVGTPEASKPRYRGPERFSKASDGSDGGGMMLLFGAALVGVFLLTRRR